MASYEGRIVAKNFLEGDVGRFCSHPQAVYALPPWPESARQAEAQRPQVSLPSTTRRENWKVTRLPEAAGDVKVIVEETTRQILGAHLLGLRRK